MNHKAGCAEEAVLGAVVVDHIHDWEGHMFPGRCRVEARVSGWRVVSEGGVEVATVPREAIALLIADVLTAASGLVAP